MVMAVSSSIKLILKLIVVPKREIMRMGNRWIMYLPQDYDEIWEELKRQGKKVRIYIEILD